MRKIQVHTTELQKKGTLLRRPEQEPVQQGKPASQQQITRQVAYRGGDRIDTSALTAADLSALQRTLGNRGIQRIIQRNDDKTASTTPPGRGLSTAFGTYWIVPDATNQSYLVEGEQITESDFAKLEKTWNDLQAGTGKVQIGETDDKGVAHGGFKTMILNQFGKLLSQPLGRGLVSGLVNGSQVVTILPTSSRRIAAATRGAGSEETSPGVKGAGGTTTIMIDADLKDDSAVAFDAAGKEVASPVFIILGHELIHAQHNAAGQNRRSQATTDPAYGNREEEETISTGTLTENMLRNEHGLKPERFGHGGRDTR